MSAFLAAPIPLGGLLQRQYVFSFLGPFPRTAAMEHWIRENSASAEWP